MKYFRPKSALVYGSEIAVWATFWATYDTARLVGMRPVVRQIAARGRLCAGAACPVGGGTSPLWRRDVPASCGLDADACRVRRGDGCRSDARCRVACRRRGCCPLLSWSVMTRCARRACDVCIAPQKRTFGLAFITSALCPKPVVSRCTNGTTIRWSHGRIRAPRAALRDRAPWRS
jgi:hypothetical protein